MTLGPQGKDTTRMSRAGRSLGAQRPAIRTAHCASPAGCVPTRIRYRNTIQRPLMKNTTKIVLLLLAAVVAITLLFYLRDNVSFWISRMATYIIVIAATFAAGWLLGRSLRNRRRDRDDRPQR